MKKLKNLIQFLNQLEERKIYYRVDKIRNDSILINVTVPGQRWEIEFLADGSIEIEKFFSDGQIVGKEELEVLFDKYSD